MINTILMLPCIQNCSNMLNRLEVPGWESYQHTCEYWENQTRRKIDSIKESIYRLDPFAFSDITHPSAKTGCPTFSWVRHTASLYHRILISFKPLSLKKKYRSSYASNFNGKILVRLADCSQLIKSSEVTLTQWHSKIHSKSQPVLTMLIYQTKIVELLFEPC